jgi:hypothetical protein
MSSEPGTVRRSADARAESTSYGDDERGSGWVIFAGMLILMAGVMNTIYGIAAIAESSFYVANTRFVFADLKTWGWIVMLIGIVQVLASLGIWARAPWARWTGVAVAAINGIAQLLFIPTYPFLALAIFTLDVLVIYGLIAYGGRSEAA